TARVSSLGLGWLGGPFRSAHCAYFVRRFRLVRASVAKQFPREFPAGHHRADVGLPIPQTARWPGDRAEPPHLAGQSTAPAETWIFRTPPARPEFDGCDTSARRPARLPTAPPGPTPRAARTFVRAAGAASRGCAAA